jgi:pimeloyl-ACP methyl ester carboxylesterase
MLAALGRPQTYVGQAREVASIARCAVNYPLGLAEAALRTGVPAGDATFDTPVLLVHGYGHNRSGWFLLDRRLRRAGFTSVHTLNYLPYVQGLPELAERLADRVTEIRAATGAEKVHVVCHSMGGIILRWYVQRLGGHEFVDTAITMGSPHSGTYAALMGVGAGARDLRPGSRVMRTLERTAQSSSVRWISYYSNIDLLVQPASSAKLDHPALHATNVLVKDHGHVSLMISPRVGRSIVDQLTAAENASEVAPLSPLQPAAQTDQTASTAAEKSSVSLA